MSTTADAKGCSVALFGDVPSPSFECGPTGKAPPNGTSLGLGHKRLKKRDGGSFLRDLLGNETCVITRGRRLPRRYRRMEWAFHVQSNDPVLAPTASEVEAATGILCLTLKDHVRSTTKKRSPRRGGRTSLRAGLRNKRPRFSYVEEDEEDDRFELEDISVKDRTGDVKSGAKGRASGVQNEGEGGNAQLGNVAVLNMLAALSGMGAMQPMMKGSGPLPPPFGLPMPMRIPEGLKTPNIDPKHIPGPSQTSLPLPQMMIPPPSLSAPSSTGVAQGSEGMPLFFGYILNAGSKGQQVGPSTAPVNMPIATSSSQNGPGPVVILPPFGMLPGGLHAGQMRAEMKGQLEKMLSNAGPPLLPMPVAPMPPAPQVPPQLNLPGFPFGLMHGGNNAGMINDQNVQNGILSGPRGPAQQPNGAASTLNGTSGSPGGGSVQNNRKANDRAALLSSWSSLKQGS